VDLALSGQTARLNDPYPGGPVDRH
jgi:hypothetical protein